jgi:hypothetical protein
MGPRREPYRLTKRCVGCNGVLPLKLAPLQRAKKGLFERSVSFVAMRPAIDGRARNPSET